jgi:hypothetical protein
VVPGSYAIDLPNGIQVANGAATPLTQFSIAFTTAGTVHPKTPSTDTVLDIGPVANTESAERTVEYRLNRVTGAFLQLTDREITH